MANVLFIKTSSLGDVIGSRMQTRTSLLAAANATLQAQIEERKRVEEHLRESEGQLRNAIARFNQVQGVTDEERDAAWKGIRAAAKKFGVEMQEGSWRELAHHGKR